MIRIAIKQCRNPFHWYNNKVGEQFNVVKQKETKSLAAGFVANLGFIYPQDVSKPIYDTERVIKRGKWKIFFHKCKNPIRYIKLKDNKNLLKLKKEDNE